MTDFDYFFEATRRAFQFLQDEFDFATPEHKTDGRGFACWMTWRNTTTQVVIAYEVLSPPWVTISPLVIRNATLVPGGVVPLWFMIREAGGQQQVIPPPPEQMSKAILNAMLLEEAGWLRRLGKDFLEGMFDRFADLRDKYEQENALRTWQQWEAD